MKKLALALVAMSLTVPAHADHWVRPYVRKDGTYVQGHMQSDPNGTKLDNYSTRGNVNPYTGQPGTRDPYAEPSTPTYQPYRAPVYTPLYTPPAPTYSPPTYQPRSYSYDPPALQPLPCAYCGDNGSSDNPDSDDGDDSE